MVAITATYVLRDLDHEGDHRRALAGVEYLPDGARAQVVVRAPYPTDDAARILFAANQRLQLELVFAAPHATTVARWHTAVTTGEAA